jgi:hypothetical protein
MREYPILSPKESSSRSIAIEAPLFVAAILLYLIVCSCSYSKLLFETLKFYRTFTLKPYVTLATQADDVFIVVMDTA